MTAEELKKRESELASDVMSLAVGKLLLKYHFFSAAVGRLKIRPFKGRMMTDGRQLCYGQSYILDRYKRDSELPVHDCLHLILHNVFRHWNIGRLRQDLWDASCDIVTEFIIAELSPALIPDENAERRAKILHDLSLEVKPMTAEKLYNYLDKINISDKQAEEYIRLFSVDDHRTWYKPELEAEKEPESELPHFFPEFNEEGEADGKGENTGCGGNSEKSTDGDDGQNGDGGNNDDENVGAESRDNEMSGGNASNNTDCSYMEQWAENKNESEKAELSRQWDEIAKQVLSEMESFGKGEDTQRLIEVLEIVLREKVDYTAFLRRFAVAGEVMRPDPEAFDHGYYCYGLELYGNVALIEPLEYKEVRRIKDFVIALDTSGSVSGKVVHDFVQKTYNILKSEESFFCRVNIHIVQCDTRVEDAAVITCEAELERYIEDLQIKGLGGTDFRPVFEYVDNERAEGRLNDLRGIIYFTDGIGVFPEKAPDYEAAFVFLEGDYERNDRPDIPPWAIKLVLQEGDVLNGK